jgi:hypothetical protein
MTLKSATYETVPNPFGGWDVKEIKRNGTLRHFASEEEAEEYLRTIAVTQPRKVSRVTDIASGKEVVKIESE